MPTFFVADTHFGHANIIRLTNRPFLDVEAMDAELIRRWNATVAPDDTVWHLGDFAVRAKPARQQELFGALNGIKHLILGNHDREKEMRQLGWKAIFSGTVKIEEKGRQLILGHYPFLEWDGFWRGVVHLHGHTHGTIPSTRRRADMAVEMWDYRPVRLAEILERLTTSPDPDPRSLAGAPL